MLRKLLSVGVVALVTLGFTSSFTPQMTAFASVDVGCYDPFDWSVDGYATTSLNQTGGDLGVSIEWVLGDGEDGGTVATGGDSGSYYTSATQVRANTFQSGSASWGFGPYIQWWSYHWAGLGEWDDWDELYLAGGCY